MISTWRDLETVLDQNYRESDNISTAPRASVAAIFRGLEGTTESELLFIQRATKPTDPWSGQMAFPGGRKEPSDRSPQHTAMRETSEEIGVDLQPAKYVGSLSEIDGGRANGRHIVVSAHAYWLDGPRPAVDPNHEVADVVWVPLSTLRDNDRYIDYHYPLAGADFPGIRLDRNGQVIWGLTLRFLADLFSRMEQPFIID